MTRVGGVVVVATTVLLGMGLVVMALLGEPGAESGSVVDVAPLVVETPAPPPTVAPEAPATTPAGPVAPPPAPAVPLDDDDDGDDDDDAIPDPPDDDD